MIRLDIFLYSCDSESVLLNINLVVFGSVLISRDIQLKPAQTYNYKTNVDIHKT